MNNSNFIHIDNLLADEYFISVIKSLANHEPIPNHLVAAYNQYSKEELELARQIFFTAKEDKESVDYGNKEKIWESIEKATAQYDRDGNAPIPDLKSHKNPTAWRRVMMYAALFIGIAMTFTWVFKEKLMINDQLFIITEMVTKTNPSGQKSRITLPDGSIAYLNAESELVYDRNFRGDQRRLYLRKGEAFFEVSKNREKPFVVIVNDITVTALGTQFNVNFFNEDLEVALVEGSVLVSNTSSNDQLMMRPSEVLKFNHIDRKLRIIPGQASDFAYWKDQVLRFNDTPVSEAIEIMSRWYAVDFSLENSPPAGLTVSGKFKNSSLELVLKNLSYSLDFEYKMINKEVKIKFKKAVPME